MKQALYLSLFPVTFPAIVTKKLADELGKYESKVKHFRPIVRAIGWLGISGDIRIGDKVYDLYLDSGKFSHESPTPENISKKLENFLEELFENLPSYQDIKESLKDVLKNPDDFIHVSDRLVPVDVGATTELVPLYYTPLDSREIGYRFSLRSKRPYKTNLPTTFKITLPTYIGDGELVLGTYELHLNFAKNVFCPDELVKHEVSHMLFLYFLLKRALKFSEERNEDVFSTMVKILREDKRKLYGEELILRRQLEYLCWKTSKSQIDGKRLKELFDENEMKDFETGLEAISYYLSLFPCKAKGFSLRKFVTLYQSRLALPIERLKAYSPNIYEFLFSYPSYSEIMSIAGNLEKTKIEKDVRREKIIYLGEKLAGNMLFYVILSSYLPPIHILTLFLSIIAGGTSSSFMDYLIRKSYRKIKKNSI
jgi:hypothetical protein